MFGQPSWLVAAVLVVIAVLLWYLFDGWVRPLARVPLVVALTPVVALAAAVVGITLSVVLSGPYEPPPRTTERTEPTAATPPVPSRGPERAEETTQRTASPSPTAYPPSTASPSASPSPSASSSPSPSASPSP